VTSTLESAPKIPCRQVADIELPSEIDGLYDLAYNFWWSWTREARQLFSSIDSDAWARYRNPVELLLNVERAQLERLVENTTFMGSYVGVQRAFRAYLAGNKDTWFRRRFPDYAAGPFAYFSMEYAIATCLRVYSGGLGVLSGDHCKTASDLGLPFVALGLLYRAGYFRQAIDADERYSASLKPLQTIRASSAIGRAAAAINSGRLPTSRPMPNSRPLSRRLATTVRCWLTLIGKTGWYRPA